jgi:hypothetical protein
MIWAKADDVLFHVRAVVRSCEWAYVKGGVKPDQWGGVNVWSAASPQAKSEDDGLVCANVYGLYWSGLLPAMMECAALYSSLSSQSCEDFFTPQVSRAPGSTVSPSHCSPADLAGNRKFRSRRWAVDVGIAQAISKPGFSQASSAGQSSCRRAGQHRRPIGLILCEHRPGYAGQLVG